MITGSPKIVEILQRSNGIEWGTGHAKHIEVWQECIKNTLIYALY
jgi:hypothetical protein